jgi:hypothetical protein
MAEFADETTRIKRALRQAGIPFRYVRHGRGTAWGWLHVGLMREATQATHVEAIRVAQIASGREGAFSERIGTD